MNENEKFIEEVTKKITDDFKEKQKTITLSREDVKDDFWFEKDYPCCGACVLANSDIQIIIQDIVKVIYFKMIDNRNMDSR